VEPKDGVPVEDGNENGCDDAGAGVLLNENDGVLPKGVVVDGVVLGEVKKEDVEGRVGVVGKLVPNVGRCRDVDVGVVAADANDPKLKAPPVAPVEGVVADEKGDGVVGAGVAVDPKVPKPM